VDLPTFERKRAELSRRLEVLEVQQRLVAATAQQHLDLDAAAASIDAFCARVRTGLANATFEQRRALVELLIDRVIVTNDEVEIRYVVPTATDRAQIPFCQLRTDYLQALQAVAGHRPLAATARPSGRCPHR
jgi:site-specific DNA recombinase